MFINDKMDLLLTPDYYIIKNGDYTLWCDRLSGLGKLIPMDNFNNLELQGKFTCIGFIYGCIGKIKFLEDGDWYLIVITKHTKLSCSPHHGIVYKIDKIALVPLTPRISLESLDFATPHNVKRSDINATIKEFVHDDSTALYSSKVSINDNSKISTDCVHNPSKYTRKELFRRERLEGRLLDALLRMFNDSNTFYYSNSWDLTNSLQRKKVYLNNQIMNGKVLNEYDDRFFWNKYLFK